MNLQLITLQGIKVDHEIYEATIPTDAGEIGVFPGHEPLVTVAEPGVIVIRYNRGDSDEKLDYYAISGGIVTISPTGIRVLVDEADSGEDIVESESEAALKRAIEMRDKASNQVELEQALELMDRHAVRLKVAGLRRRRRR
ncbi:MAG TPA: ATP synthase F1 subunit epsilon [Candidatus Saccharibacteria bacterium]|nr:ATP synthase F1 subunit epsilon [Candidatus Saccharibacteria bacterium]HRQ06780.1 ATP synthase F1 subunit epsilon [Candidatus Saccharibacteria bacterium]